MERKITVLMALYNGGKYLQQAVQSVLDQTYGNFEFLIVNDCSTDDSLKTIESFHDDRIRIHNNVKNLGQTKSLNLGLKLAEGDYIARMDGDDIALPHWLETQVDFIERNPTYSVVSSYAVAIDEGNRVKKICRPPINKMEIIFRSLTMCPIHHVGSVIKKSDVVESGGYDERYIFAMDYALWEKLLRNNANITTTPKILVAFREHSQSVSRSEPSKRVLEEAAEVVKKNIRQYVNAEFSENELNVFCKANYDARALTVSEFKKAVEVTKRICANFNLALEVDDEKMAEWARESCRSVYLKKILCFITEEKYEAVKELSLNGIREFGPRSVFMVLFGASMLGGTVLRRVPEFYSRVRRENARFQLGNLGTHELFN